MVGREHELGALREALTSRRHVVLRGRYGIGRTTLVRALSSSLGPSWHFLFVDGRSTPMAISQRMLESFVAARRVGVSEKRGYRDVRRRLSRGRFSTAKAVLVLDDIDRLTCAKWDLLRFLAAIPQVRVVAIVESFLPERDVNRLRAVFYPSVGLELGHLSFENSRRYFADTSTHYGLAWDEERVRLLAKSRGGYPLEMADTVARAKAARESGLERSPTVGWAPPERQGG